MQIVFLAPFCRSGGFRDFATVLLCTLRRGRRAHALRSLSLRHLPAAGVHDAGPVCGIVRRSSVLQILNSMPAGESSSKTKAVASKQKQQQQSSPPAAGVCVGSAHGIVGSPACRHPTPAAEKNSGVEIERDREQLDGADVADVEVGECGAVAAVWHVGRRASLAQGQEQLHTAAGCRRTRGVSLSLLSLSSLLSAYLFALSLSLAVSSIFSLSLFLLSLSFSLLSAYLLSLSLSLCLLSLRLLLPPIAESVT